MQYRHKASSFRPTGLHEPEAMLLFPPITVILSVQNRGLSFVPMYRSSYFLNLSFADWADEAVSKSEILRLIYQGRFLHGNVTLGGKLLPTIL